MTVISWVFAITCLAVLGIVLFRQGRRIKNLQQQFTNQDKQFKQFMKDIKALFSADIIFGKSVTELQTQLNSIDSKIEQLENQRSNDGSYPHALKILDMGGDKQEIIDNCNLSNAEAELLLNLHAYRNASKLTME